jgi:hypothetical protein
MIPLYRFKEKILSPQLQQKIGCWNQKTVNGFAKDARTFLKDTSGEMWGESMVQEL